MARVSNSEVMERFKRIDEISDTQQIKRIHDQIITDLSFLVYSNTSRYRKFSNYEDLNQEGFVGLIKATKRFDHRRFPNFFVFANQWILNGIMRSAKKHDVVYNPKRIKTVYCGDDQLMPPDESAECVDEQYETKERNGIVNDAISSLPVRDRGILMNLFGINSGEHTLRETEKYCGLTYERIRQIKNRALEKLKLNKSLMEIDK